MMGLSELTKVVNESQGQAPQIHQIFQKDVNSTIKLDKLLLKSSKSFAKKACLSRNIENDVRFDWKSWCFFCAQPCSVDEWYLDSNFADIPTKNFTKLYCGILKEGQGRRQHCYDADF